MKLTYSIILWLISFVFVYPKDYTHRCGNKNILISLDMIIDSEKRVYNERDPNNTTFEVFNISSGNYDQLNFILYTSINNTNYYIEESEYYSIDLSTISSIANSFSTENNFGVIDNNSIRSSEETILGASPIINDQVNILFLDIQDEVYFLQGQL